MADRTTAGASGRPEDLDRLAIASAIRDLPPPRSARRVAKILGLFLPILVLLLVVVPWQQTAVGSGQVIAYAPGDRPQDVESPISGRIVAWFVAEGDIVAAGDPIAELADNDLDRPARLAEQRDAAETALTAAERALEAYRVKREAEVARRDLVLAELDARIAELERLRAGDAAKLQTATWNQARVTALEVDGLASQRERELADLGVSQADAALRARDATIAAARTARRTAEREAEARIAAADADVRSAQAKVAAARARLAELDTAIARLDQRLVRAPRAGRVHRVRGGPGGEQVRAGDVLVSLVPITNSRAAEILVDGNDAALVREGAEVRLLFEGWPAVQFVGFPGADGGTYGGRVAFVDAAADEAGRVRVVVVPDPALGVWPDPARLRQGVRVKGFVLLGRVRLGYELWRQLNGFPPLPDVQKGSKARLPSAKKPRAPVELR